MNKKDPLFEAGFDHPCRGTCSGWQQGYERGQSDKEKEHQLKTTKPKTILRKGGQQWQTQQQPKKTQ